MRCLALALGYRRVRNAALYSTFLGGTGEDVAYGVALDGTGNAYVTGYTSSTDFPVVAGGFQTSKASGYDAFVTKLNNAGTGAVYSTFLGGGAEDYGIAIGVDSSANAYVGGYTASSDFPHTAGVAQAAKGAGYDGFVAKLNAAGTGLAYGTFLGGAGDDYVLAIALDSLGNAYVTGDTSSADFPKSSDALQSSLGGVFSAFLTKVNAAGAVFDYASFLGGSGFETGYGMRWYQVRWMFM